MKTQKYLLFLFFMVGLSLTCFGQTVTGNTNVCVGNFGTYTLLTPEPQADSDSTDNHWINQIVSITGGTIISFEDEFGNFHPFPNNTVAFNRYRTYKGTSPDGSSVEVRRIVVVWNNNPSQDCENRIRYQIREFTRPDTGTSNVVIHLDGGLNVCVGPQQPENITPDHNSDRCQGQSTLYTVIPGPGDGPRFDWFVNGSLTVSNTSSTNVSIVNDYDANASMEICVRSRDCNTTSTSYCRTFQQPLIAIQLSGPYCVYPGSTVDFYLQGGCLSNATWNIQPSYINWNTYENDCYVRLTVPSSFTGNAYVSVTGTDPCAGQITRFKNFSASYNCGINGPYYQTSAGSPDASLPAQHIASGRNENSEGISFQVFPNPVHNQNVNLQLDQNAMVKIVDNSGRTVVSATRCFAGNNKLLTDQLSPGIYIVLVHSMRGDVLGQKKLVIY